jgi:hypothetical protein
METFLNYVGPLFAALFVAKTIWLGYLFWRGRVSLDDDERGPVSGWGTPRG